MLELFAELVTQFVGKRFEEGARTGAGDPVEDRVVALVLEYVQIRRLPRVDLVAALGEEVQVKIGLEPGESADVAEVLRVRLLFGELVEAAIGGGTGVVGNLDCEGATVVEVGQ